MAYNLKILVFKTFQVVSPCLQGIDILIYGRGLFSLCEFRLCLPSFPRQMFKDDVVYGLSRLQLILG